MNCNGRTGIGKDNCWLPLAAESSKSGNSTTIGPKSSSTRIFLFWNPTPPPHLPGLSIGKRQTYSDVQVQLKWYCGSHGTDRPVFSGVSYCLHVSTVILLRKWGGKSAAVMFLRPIPAITDPITCIFTADLSLSDDLISRTK